MFATNFNQLSIGDVVKGYNGTCFDDKEIIISGISDCIKWDNNNKTCNCMADRSGNIKPGMVEIIKSNKKGMANIVEKVKLALKAEPEKSLIKAGLLDAKEELTSDGRSILEIILVEKYKKELKEQADIILSEKE